MKPKTIETSEQTARRFEQLQQKAQREIEVLRGENEVLREQIDVLQTENRVLKAEKSSEGLLTQALLKTDINQARLRFLAK